MKIKKIVFFTIVVASLFIINSLVHSIYSLWQKQSLVVDAQQNLETEKKKNQKLKEELSIVNNKQFIEEEARDKLFLAKPGEKVIVMPSVALQASPSVSLTPVDTRSNWKRWWELFF
jgi:cell division protein FtsB